MSLPGRHLRAIAIVKRVPTQLTNVMERRRHPFPQSHRQASTSIDFWPSEWSSTRCPLVGQKDEQLHNKLTIILTGLAGCALLASGISLAPPGTLALTLCLGALLLGLSVIDFRTLTLPDTLTASTVLLGILMVWLTRPEAWRAPLIGGLVGYGILVMVELGYRHLRGKDGLGRGDAKLLGALGVWTGWAGLAPIMLVASASALVGVIGLSALGIRKVDADTPIPFGPFIALGGWVVWLGGRFFLPTGLY